jgi:hypothetical protein
VKRLAIAATILAVSVVGIRGQDAPKKVEMQCRALADAYYMVGPDEVLVDGMVCKRVKQAAPDPQTAAQPLKQATANSQTATHPLRRAAADPQTPEPPGKPCLIVTSAEGHRFRNSMIAGALAGGVGFAAGLAFSGGRYEYRDSYNLPPSDVKTKYKGPQLQKMQKDGIHVIVVDKKDKTGAEVREARAACRASDSPQEN